MAAAQYSYVRISGFNEQGSLLPLQIHSDSQDSFRTDLGVQVSHAWHVGSVLLIPSVTAAWAHQYLLQRPTDNRQLHTISRRYCDLFWSE